MKEIEAPQYVCIMCPIFTAYLVHRRGLLDTWYHFIDISPSLLFTTFYSFSISNLFLHIIHESIIPFMVKVHSIKLYVHQILQWKASGKNKIPHFLQLWDKSSQENKNWRPEGVFTLFRINTLYVNTECLCLSFVNIYFLYCRGSGKILNFLWFGFPYFSSLNWTVNRAERERDHCAVEIFV